MNRRIALTLLAYASLAPAALGDSASNLSFDVSIPRDWKLAKSAGRWEAHAPGDTMTAILVQRTAPASGLHGLDGQDLVDDEMDDFTVEIDQIRSADGVFYRRVEGSCMDGDDPSRFKMKIILSKDEKLAGLLFVYASTEDLADPGLQSTMDDILRSLRAT
jgi:hypothetical protein